MYDFSKVYIYIYRIQIIKVSKTINTISKNLIIRKLINKIIMANNISIIGCHLIPIIVYIY